MTRARLAAAALALLALTGCAPVEPINGCLLAAANRREVLRARAFAHPAIPARLLALHFAGRPDLGHVALVYRLEPEGWFVYDDTYGARALRLAQTRLIPGSFPDALETARSAFAPLQVSDAHWFDLAR